MHFDNRAMHTVLRQIIKDCLIHFVFLTRGAACWPQITAAKKLYALCIAQKTYNPKPNYILPILGLLNDAFNS